MQNLRFDRFGDSAKGKDSKDRQAFLKYRAEWRKGYKIVVEANRGAKAFIQANPTEHAITAEARQTIEQTKVMARSMMMALEAIKIQKDFDNKRNTTLLEPRAPVAMKVREKYVPSDEEIEKRRQEKKERLAQAD